MALGDGLDISNPQSVISGMFNALGAATDGPGLAPVSAEPAVDVAFWGPAQSAGAAGVAGLPATAANKQLGLQNMLKK